MGTIQQNVLSFSLLAMGERFEYFDSVIILLTFDCCRSGLCIWYSLLLIKVAFFPMDLVGCFLMFFALIAV